MAFGSSNGKDRLADSQLDPSVLRFAFVITSRTVLNDRELVLKCMNSSPSAEFISCFYTAAWIKPSEAHQKEGETLKPPNLKMQPHVMTLCPDITNLADCSVHYAVHKNTTNAIRFLKQ